MCPSLARASRGVRQGGVRSGQRLFLFLNSLPTYDLRLLLEVCAAPGALPRLPRPSAAPCLGISWGLEPRASRLGEAEAVGRAVSLHEAHEAVPLLLALHHHHALHDARLAVDKVRRHLRRTCAGARDA